MIKDGGLAGAPSLDGLRMSLTLRRIGGIYEKEHAVDIVDKRPNYRFSLFEKTGSLVTADGTGDEGINLEGLTEPLTFMQNGSENEAGRGGAGGGGRVRVARRKIKGGELVVEGLEQ